MLTNSLVLNLRSQAQAGESTSPSTVTDTFFRSVYGQPPAGNEAQSIMDTILGNIGEPLMVDDEGDEMIDEDDREESTQMEDSETFQSNSQESTQMEEMSQSDSQGHTDLEKSWQGIAVYES